jgi:hypothetical protein
MTTIDDAKQVLVIATGLRVEDLQARYPEQFAEMLRQEGYNSIGDWTATQLEKGPAYDALVAATAQEISIANTIKVVLPVILSILSTLLPGLGL